MWSVGNDNIHIVDSYLITKRKDMYELLNQIKEEYPELDVWNRSLFNLSCEWRAHNLLYKLNIFRDRVKDVDLNYPQNKLINIIYLVLGIW